MNGFMEWLINDGVAQWVTVLVIVFLELVSYIIKLISSKMKDGKMKQILMLVPEAMEWAEYQGKTADDKLNLFKEYITNRVKGVSESFLETVIEPYIKMTKTVNSTTQEKVKSIYSRTTK